MPTLSERLHSRPGFLEEEKLPEKEVMNYGALPPTGTLGPSPLPSEQYLGRAQSPVLARQAMEGTPPTAFEAGEKIKKDIGAGMGVAGRGLGVVGRGLGAVGESVQAPIAGFTRGLFGLEEQRSDQQPELQLEQQPVIDRGAVREVAMPQVAKVSPTVARQPVTQPTTASPEYGAEGQAALTGMSQDEQMWVRQKALSHSNPNIRNWAKNWKDGGVIKEGATTHIPVFDTKTGMPLINPKTGEMEHISVARHGPREKKLEDPRIGIAARDLAAEKEGQKAGFGASQAEALYKAANEMIKSAATSDNPQENYAQAARLREQADEIFGTIGGAVPKAPTGAPTIGQMKQFTIESDPIQLDATRKYFMNKGESGKEEFMSLPTAAQNAIFPSR